MTGKDYLLEHGILDSTAEKFGITWNDDFLNIPIKDVDGKVIWVKHRNLKHNPKDPASSKYKNDAGSQITLFNLDKYKDSDIVILAEGEMDAIRLSQENIPAVSVTAGAEGFSQVMADLLLGKRVYICYDTDSGGVNGTRKVLEFLPSAKVIDLPTTTKDVCEYFFQDYKKKDFTELAKKALDGRKWQVKHPVEDYSILTTKELYAIEYPPERFIIDKFLPTTGITMFSGDSGAGKSFVSLEIVRAIFTGTPFLDHFTINTPNIPILIIDKENGLPRMQRRMKGMGVPESENIYTLKYSEKFNLQDAKFMQAVQDFIQVNKVGIVILDSFIDILVGSENAAPDISVVFNALRSISTDICWVILHHESKPMPKFQRAASDRARGSSNIKAQVDFLFSLLKTKQLRIIHVEQAKARDYEIIPKFAVEFQSGEGEDMSGFRYMGEVKDDTTAVDEAATFIVDFLTNNPNKHRQEIIDASEREGLSPAGVGRALKMLKEKKIIDSKRDLASKNKKIFFILENADKEDDDFSDLDGGLGL
jgi:5S rRNA maturation endonuclease (ribonuclease M5)